MRRGAPTRRGGGRDGFLMVEALAALALGALILVALLSLTGLMRRSADRAAWGVQMTEVTSRTVDTIAREVRRAAHRRWAAPPPPDGASAQATPIARQPSTGSGASGQSSQNQQQGYNTSGQRGGQNVDGEPEGGQGQGAPPPDRPFAFVGLPNKLMFAVTPMQPSGLRAPVFVAYQIDGAGGVLRAEGPLLPDALGPAGVTLGTVERIDPGPERLKFAYVDRQSGSETILDAWTEPLRMPVAVRIDRMDPASGQIKSSLRVAIMVDGEPSCAGRQGVCSRVEKSVTSAGAASEAQQQQQQGAQNGQGEPQ